MMNFAADMLHNTWKEKPGVRNVYALNMFTFALSLGALSLFPHQEPRFLIPLTLPIVLMNAHKLRTKVFGRKPLLALWYAFNICMTVFFGLVHQGGVYPTVSYIGRGSEVHPDAVEANYVFSNTYMPPKFPLLQPKYREQSEPYFVRSHRISFHDMAGDSLKNVSDKLVALGSRSKYLRNFKHVENYVVLPNHLIRDLEKESGEGLVFDPVLNVFPHLSTENMPSFDLSGLVPAILADPVEALWKPLSDCSLSLFRVDLGKVQTVEVKAKRSTRAS